MKKYLLFFLLIPILNFGQQQIGQNIDHINQPDATGTSVAISEDGNIIAVGSPSHSANGIDKAGAVRVFRNLAGNWVQIGQVIEGTSINDQFGHHLSLSADGKVVAIATHNLPGNSGYVQVYRNVLGNWTKVGTDILGAAGVAFFNNHHISLSADGSIIAVGDGNATTPNGAHSGVVRLYENISGVWTQLGQDINGKTTWNKSGEKVSLSANGRIVAFTSRSQNSNSGNEYVSVYYRNTAGNWVQLGNDFYTQGSWIQGGTTHISISLSANGGVLAIGNCYAPNNSQITSSMGMVQIYQYEHLTNTWTQIGQDITDPYAYGQFGACISLSSDGDVVAISDHNSEANGVANAGFVQVYRKISGTWTQIGSTIGKNTNEMYKYGIALSGNGNTLAVGLRLRPATVFDPLISFVRVYDMTKPMSSDSFVMKSFNIYPNPATDVLHISLENNLILGKVIIYNNLGQIVKETSEESFDTSTLASGIYYVEIHTNEGKATKKVVVK